MFKEALCRGGGLVGSARCDKSVCRGSENGHGSLQVAHAEDGESKRKRGMAGVQGMALVRVAGLAADAETMVPDGVRRALGKKIPTLGMALRLSKGGDGVS